MKPKDNPYCTFTTLRPQENVADATNGHVAKQAKIITEKDLSPDQKEVYDLMLKFANTPQLKLLTVGGVAGSGKTTVLSLFAKTIKQRAFYCTFTGKAACVLRNKLMEHGVDPEYCGTIHSLIYVPIVDWRTKRILGWKKRPELDCDLIVVDEGSMVGQKIWNDLRFYNKPILVVGDHAQLPPINSCINLMENPTLKLEKIHRQAEGNPILKLSAMIRNGERYENYDFGDDRVRFVSKYDSKALGQFIEEAYLKPGITSAERLDSAVLTYYNSSRVKFNKGVRADLGYGSIPEDGDVVICLKNWYYDDGSIYNGMRGLVKESVSNISDNMYTTKIDFMYDYMGIEGHINSQQFDNPNTFSTLEDVEYATGERFRSWGDVGLLFDYGYALTCHKAQGSQFSNVLVYVEQNSRMTDSDFRRWIYTATTRSSDRLVVAI